MKLAKNILYYSKRKGLTISALAKLSGVKQPTLHGWTTGRSVKKIEDLKKVSIALEVGLHTLLFGEKDPFETDTSQTLQEVLSGDIRIIIEKMKEKS